MPSLFAAWNAPVARRIERVSGIRPVTLLIAFGIVLITGIIMATGIAGNHLRNQTLHAIEQELGRTDSMLAEIGNHWLKATDAPLSEIADRLTQVTANNAATLSDAVASDEIRALIRGKLGRYPRLTAIAVIGPDGQVLDSAGAWPTGEAVSRDIAKQLGARPTAASVIGAPVSGTSSGGPNIPFAHRIGPAGGKGGVVVGLLPASAFEGLFKSGAFGEDDVAISLVRRDGSVLARYPAQAGAGAAQGSEGDVDAVFADPTTTMARHVPTADGGWRIEALHAFADYPVAVAVSRSGDLVLQGWSRQAWAFGVFTLLGTLGIGLMVYLIARQFQTHTTLETMRAEKIELERARLAAEAELLKNERLSVLGQLTATVAHELRNPLSAIRNTLFTVKELTRNTEVKLDRPIARMERSIERCDRIISDLLEYTRHRGLNLANVCFDRWIGDVLAEQHIAEPVVLSTELAAGEALVAMDADRVRRVVINLVENAAQALGELPADREKHIAVSTRLDADTLLLEIDDTGPGIPPENLERIFEPLFSTKSFGTGLGLPTVKQIIVQHGGDITVESEVGRGTCVKVCLPLKGEVGSEVRVAA